MQLCPSDGHLALRTPFNTHKVQNPPNPTARGGEQGGWGEWGIVVVCNQECVLGKLYSLWAAMASRSSNTMMAGSSASGSQGRLLDGNGALPASSWLLMRCGAVGGTFPDTNLARPPNRAGCMAPLIAQCLCLRWILAGTGDSDADSLEGLGPERMRQ